VLHWLLDEPRSEAVRESLASAELVMASSLTIVECDRVLVRAVATNILPEATAAERRAVLARTVDHWVTFDLDPEVLDRVRRPFPAEPIRTLDAIHLATAILARSLVTDLAVLSLDERVRRSAVGMGLRVLPAATAA
jgi:predicted nucleic acid-binding protein